MKKGEQRIYTHQQEITNLSVGKKQASLLAATTQTAQVSEPKQILQLADEDIILINKWHDDAQGMFKRALICLK